MSEFSVSSLRHLQHFQTEGDIPSNLRNPSRFVAFSGLGTARRTAPIQAEAKLATRYLAPEVPMVNGKARRDSFAYLSGNGRSDVTIGENYMRIVDDLGDTQEYSGDTLTVGLMRVINAAGAQKHVQKALAKPYYRREIDKLAALSLSNPKQFRYPEAKLADIFSEFDRLYDGGVDSPSQSTGQSI